MDTLLVTGGAGFIGSNFVRYALAHTTDRVVVLDKLTYAGRLENLDDVRSDPRVAFVRGDIADAAELRAVLQEYRPRSIVNFAAETHVDRSIDEPGGFVQTNIVGTYEVLEASRQYVGGALGPCPDGFRVLHVSTDEVYGSLGAEGLFREDSPYEPNSPYAASKASADHLVRSYHRTFDMPLLITNCSNNYGPYQFPEKLIPLMTLNALEGKSLPIYGDGRNVRDWLYVEDHCAGILLVLTRGRTGESYNIGGGNERTNLEIIAAICEQLERLAPARQNAALRERGIESYEKLKTFVPDRKGHDRRYAIDATKITNELGWRAKHDFDSGLAATIEWYLGNREWCLAVQQGGNYNRERLGLPTDGPGDATKG